LRPRRGSGDDGGRDIPTLSLPPLAESCSPYRCFDCGEPLLYGRAFAIFDFHRAHGRRATRSEMSCEGCDPGLIKLAAQAEADGWRRTSPSSVLHKV
jgi:hypothetical protein